MKTSKLFRLGLLLAVVLIAGSAVLYAAAAVESTAPATAPAKGQTALDVIKAQGNCTEFLAALTVTHTDKFLMGEGPVTVFVPTDEAFAKMDQKWLKEMKTDPSKSANYESMVENHIVQAKLTVAEIAKKKALDTGDNPLTVTSEGGKVKVANATIIKADIPASNGYVQIVDSVIRPFQK
jgi:uncharacterized surface protein with fasciclin (FAS1) repeats